MLEFNYCVLILPISMSSNDADETIVFVCPLGTWGSFKKQGQNKIFLIFLFECHVKQPKVTGAEPTECMWFGVLHLIF